MSDQEATRSSAGRQRIERLSLWRSTLVWTCAALTLLGVAVLVFRDSDFVQKTWAGYLVLLALLAGFLLTVHNQIKELDELVEVAKQREIEDAASSAEVMSEHHRARKATLRRDRIRLQARIRWQASLRTVLTVAILFDAASAALIDFDDHFDYLRLAALLLVLVFSLQVTRERLRDLEADLRQLEYETAVVDADPADKAETLFLKHQFELRRYYDQTLRHGSLIFYLGVVLLALGAGVVVTGLVLLSEGDDKSTAQYLVTGGLAGIGGLMTNYVARMYFKMHTAAVESMSTFHDRLVRDHDLHFANMLMTRDDASDHSVADQIALILARGNNLPPEAQQDKGTR